MQDTAKYLIHADITANGVVERSDVVGAVFGQTEGLLGDELDLRDLQSSSKVGRIDVEVDSKNGQSFGRITIATNLDRVETAILGAALETIERIGPCRSTVEVRRIEDARAAKRREIVERSKSLLWEAFDDSVLSSKELIEEVRREIRIEDITEYEGFPAGPRVADSDAILLVEGRSDVLTLLQYGIKNAIAVEGTDVPDAVADLTEERTVTAFLDGDRGGELILKELTQVAELDYVAFAPEGQSVEDLDRSEVMEALRSKVPYDRIAEVEDPLVATAGEDGSREKPKDAEGDVRMRSEGRLETKRPENSSGAETTDSADRSEDSSTGTTQRGDEPTTVDATSDAVPETLRGHVEEVIEGETGQARLLDAELRVLSEADADDAFDLLAGTDPVPTAVVVDGELTQRVLDVAAQRGVGQIVASSEGEFVKQPTSVRIRTADQLRTPTEA